MLHGARGSLAHGWRHLRRAALGNGSPDARGARALRGAADRAQVLRVLDLIERDDHRRGQREQLRGARVGVGAASAQIP